MVKADSPWPRPLHVAWQSPYLNCSGTLLEPNLCGLPAYLNGNACNFPRHDTFPGLSFPAFSSLGTEQTNELQGFLQYPNHHWAGDSRDIKAGTEQQLKERLNGGGMQNENPQSSQKKLLIFDQSGNKTRLFYSPVFPLAQSPIDVPTRFAHVSDENEEGQAVNVGEKYPFKCALPEDSDENHINSEESEMHEDTEEINALLYSDEDVEDYIDDDEVTSTGCSPLSIKRTHTMLKQFENMKEEIASSDQPNKRLKLIDDGYKKRSSSINSSCSVRLNESCEYVSDAESKYSSGQRYSAKHTRGEGNSAVCDIQLKKDKIHESLRVLENLVPGAKGKQPLLVIDGTIEYLKSLMSQTGTLGLKDIE